MEEVQWEDLPGDWPKHLTMAVCQMNDRVLPLTGYSPRELLLGFVIEDHRQPLVEVLPKAQDKDIVVHMVFVDLIHAHAFQSTVQHVAQCKMKFDGKVVEVTFRECEALFPNDPRTLQNLGFLRNLETILFLNSLRTFQKFGFLDSLETWNPSHS